jgi:hypothetical protein
MCGRGLESIRGEWFAIRVTLGKVMTPHLGAVKRAREVIWPTRPTSWTKTKTPPFMKVEKLSSDLEFVGRRGHLENRLLLTCT